MSAETIGVGELKARIAELEHERDDLAETVAELERDAEIVSSEFEKDCWRAVRSLLIKVGHDDFSEGVTADAACEIIYEAIDDANRRAEAALLPTGVDRGGSAQSSLQKMQIGSAQSQPGCDDSASRDASADAEPSGRWRKRPVVVDAWRVRDFASAHQASDPAKWNAQPEWLRKARLDGRIVVTPSTVLVGTAEGDMRAQRDDWIIRGVQGELYPCKPDIFAQTYEAAE